MLSKCMSVYAKVYTVCKTTYEYDSEQRKKTQKQKSKTGFDIFDTGYFNPSISSLLLLLVLISVIMSESANSNQKF